MYFHFRAFLEYLQLFFNPVYPFDFFVIISPFPYFAPKSRCLPCIWLLVCLRPFFPYLLLEFSFVVLVLFCLYCLALSRYLFSFPSLLSTILFISSSSNFCFNCAGGCPRGEMVKAMDCGIVVREFVLQVRYYIHFRANTIGKGMNPLSSQLWVK